MDMKSRLSWKYWRSSLSVRFRVAVVRVSAEEMTFFPRHFFFTKLALHFFNSEINFEIPPQLKFAVATKRAKSGINFKLLSVIFTSKAHTHMLIETETLTNFIIHT